VLLAAQVLAMALTLHGVAVHVGAPLGLHPVAAILAPLAGGLLLAEVLREPVFVRRQAVLALGCAAAAAGTLIVRALKPAELSYLFEYAYERPRPGSFETLGLLLALAIGLGVGPLLDVQLWRRAELAARAGLDPRRAFASGAAQFAIVIGLHGVVALAYTSTHTPAEYSLSAVAYGLRALGTFAQPAYLAGLLAIAASLVAGSSHALRAYAPTLPRGSGLLAGLVPGWRAALPTAIPLLAGIAALIALATPYRLEHALLLFGTFGVGFGAAALRALLRPEAPRAPLSGLVAVATLGFAISQGALVADRLGFTAFGALLPLVYALRAGGRGTREESKEAYAWAPPLQPRKAEEADKERLPSPSAPEAEPAPAASPAVSPSPPAALAPHFEADGWFVAPHVVTLGDTSAAGNAYFATHLDWVGKARELFFLAVMPAAAPGAAAYDVLTREVRHKFAREALPFDRLRIGVRIARHDRKRVVLEHRIVRADGVPLGRGEQTLFFVEAATRRLIDIPGEVRAAFLPHALGATVGGRGAAASRADGDGDGQAGATT
jgi:acyl-CoA thioesterase FadM